MNTNIKRVVEVDYDNPVVGSECGNCHGNFNYYPAKVKKFISTDITQEEIKYYRCTKCGAKKITPFGETGGKDGQKTDSTSNSRR